MPALPKTKKRTKTSQIGTKTGKTAATAPKRPATATAAAPKRPATATEAARTIHPKPGPGRLRNKVRPGAGPQEPAMGTRAFKRLQKLWYKKLKQADPEWRDIEAGLEDGRLNGQSSTDVRAQERYIHNSGPTQHYYSRWTCYLGHHDKSQLTYLERTVIELYGKGLGVQDIHPYVRKYVNKYQLHYLIERLRVHVEYWNKTDPNGMDFVSDLDICRPLKK